MTSQPESVPEIKVLSGNPSAEELAAVIAVLQAASATATHSATVGKLRKTTSTWARNASVLRSPIVPGPGQWRASVRSGLN